MQEANSGYQEVQKASCGYLEVQAARVGIRRCRSEVSKQWVSGGAGAKLWVSGVAGGKLWMSGGAGSKLWVSGGAGGMQNLSFTDRHSWFHSWFLHSCFHRYPKKTLPKKLYFELCNKDRKNSILLGLSLTNVGYCKYSYGLVD